MKQTIVSRSGYRRDEALTLESIRANRGPFQLAVDHIRLNTGTISCIVGINGCGKTTLLLTMLGLIPHAGECRVGGVLYDGSQPQVKARIGFIPDDPRLLFEELTAVEQWSVTASVLASICPGGSHAVLMARAIRLAESIGFAPPSKLIRDYSHGMRKKTQIVNALIGSPEVIVVDELRNGLDPIALKQVEELLCTERDRGAAIIAATHDLWWAERFADDIYIVSTGCIVACGAVDHLLQGREQHLEEAFMRIVGASV